MGDGARVVPSRDPRGLESDGDDARCLRLRRGCTALAMRRELRRMDTRAEHGPCRDRRRARERAPVEHRRSTGKSSVRDRLVEPTRRRAASRARGRARRPVDWRAARLPDRARALPARRRRVSNSACASSRPWRPTNSATSWQRSTATRLRAQARAAVADVVDGLALLAPLPRGIAARAEPAAPLEAGQTRRNCLPRAVAAAGGWRMERHRRGDGRCRGDARRRRRCAAERVRAAVRLGQRGSRVGGDERDGQRRRRRSRSSTCWTCASRRSGSRTASSPSFPLTRQGWSQTRPRAVAEPRLEAWAARRLGDPASIVVAEVAGTRHTTRGGRARGARLRLRRRRRDT